MVDLVIVVVLAVFAVAGFQRGAIVSVIGLASIGGGALFLGAFAASLAGPRVGFLAGGVTAAAIGIGLALRMHHLDEAVAQFTGRLRQFDRPLGAFISCAVGCAFIWLVAAVGSLVPKPTGVLAQVTHSKVADAMLSVVSPTGNVAALLLRSGFVPALQGPIVVADPPDEIALASAPAAAAAESVLKIEGEACGQRTTGTGWVVAPRLVVTNAHVVAGHEATRVYVANQTVSLPARIQAFDPQNDIALLLVPGLTTTPLQRRRDPQHGESAVTVGFPQRFNRTMYPARFDRVVTYEARDIYERTRADTKLSVFRGEVHAGNSGSPVLDAAGRVMATVTAATVGQKVGGIYAVPDEVLSDVLTKLNQPFQNMCLDETGPREL